ncbi:MAG: LysR family transcriptional regulator [Jatrophihabitans sp.]|uniref:LysR family transcriptional regulator n=1 Tax=Jatrophihabitans sp. TaxID=1932789 RepID=UPI003F7E789B
MMELRRLRLLDELARRGTVAAVAEALAYSPSSVSVQLAELEREAGVPLLQRVGRGVVLTAAGERLAVHAAEALAADESVRAEIADVGDTVRGRLTMTFVQTPALVLLPDVLHRLVGTSPHLDIRVQQRETAPALDDLRSRAVDLVVGIEYDPVPVPRYRDVDRVDLLREDVLVALHPEHPALPARGKVRLADLVDDAWAGGVAGTGLDAVLRTVANRCGGFEPDIRHRSDDALLLSALVTSGRAAALLPAMLVSAVPGLVARPLREGRLQRSVFTAVRSTTVHAPAVVAARAAIDAAARHAARRSRHLEYVAAG